MLQPLRATFNSRLAGLLEQSGCFKIHRKRNSPACESRLQIIVRSIRDLGKDGQKIFDAQGPTIRGNSKWTDFHITLTVNQHQEALAARDYAFRHPSCSHSHLLGKSLPISAAAASSAYHDHQRSVALSASRPYQHWQSPFTSSSDTTSTSSAQAGRHESRPVHSQHVSDDPQTPDGETSKTSGAAAGTADPKEHTGVAKTLEEEDDSKAGRSQEQDETAVEGACERMVLEVVRMLQDGKVEQAEFFLLEGIKYVEGCLAESAGLASLLDQLALVQFLAGKLPEAEATARRMSAAVEKLFAEEEAAVAMCSLRLGTVLAGKGEWHEAVPLLRQAQDALNMAFGEKYEALGEAQYYLALAEVADSTEASLPSYDTELVQGLRKMRENAGVGGLLANAALREHHKILQAALQLEDWSRSEALFLQEMRLHEALDHRSEGLALLLYQFSTLKFIQGHLEDARKLSQRSAAIAEAVFKAGSDQAMLRTHRLGTIAAAARDTTEADKLLVQSLAHFTKRLGQDNPISGEARFYLAFARLQVLETKLVGADPFDKILAPKQREDLLSQLTDGLQAMSKGYGNDHILVRKARDLEGVFA